MLVEVKEAALTLGVTKYVRGDIFDCRDPEALVLITGGTLKKASANAIATRDAPQPGKTGLSNKGVPTAPKENEVIPRSLNKFNKKKKRDVVVEEQPRQTSFSE